MSSQAQAPVFRITPGIQDYAWGKKGSSSLAAQLATKSIGEEFTVDEDKTYAELWMGTHPTLPSKVDNTPLTSILASNPNLIGDKIAKHFPDSKDGSLPFLFKVLSIGTALSIQAHPNKTLAERLHRERGDVYKDPNHKPEMAIALTPFNAFLNFLPLPTLLLNLLSTPELETIIPSELTSKLASSLLLPDTRPPTALLFTPTIATPTTEQKDLLKQIFAALMNATEAQVKDAIASLLKRFEEGDVKENEKSLVDLIRTLNEQYPDDVGVLCVFVLNVVELKPGEAAFLGADMPHAYISGDIIECMAQSDNVVRAGLTPKLRDVETLVEMLTYEPGPGSKQLLKPETISDATLLYDPPIDEFSVYHTKLDGDKKEDQQRSIEGPSIAVVTSGKGQVSWSGEIKNEVEVEKGDVVFLGAGVDVKWESDKGLEVFRAYVEAK